jgi:phospholipid/cholesterol/gamma-HCH transport system substrate-binding protein
MNPSEASTSIKFRVGVFTLMGLLLIGAITVYVNDKPFWWRACHLVHINIQDATGLKMKSPVRSLGLEIGYIRSVELSETHVRLGICITAPVDVLPETEAFIRGEGFLGDKFVELKPVKYRGIVQQSWLEQLSPIPSAQAAEGESTVVTNKSAAKAKDIPVGERTQDVQQVVERVDGLVKEMTSLTTNIKSAIDPNELRQTIRQLNKTLENASKTLAPEGNLNTTAQRTLAKLEDAIEQLRDQMTRINHGEGSLGMLLNDPTYAEEIKKALKNVNKLLNKVQDFRFEVELANLSIPSYSGSRGYFRLSIWPTPERYYMLGITVDPRGKETVTTTKTESANGTSITKTTQDEQGGILLTAMLGRLFYERINLAAGVLHGDGAVSAQIFLP